MIRTGLIVCLLLWAGPAAAQVTGYASLMFDVFPDLSGAPGTQRTGEMRARLVAERKDAIGDHLRLVLSGAVDGLVASRARAAGRSSSGVRDAIAQPIEVHAEGIWPAIDVRVGMSRIVWGRLDEFQPTDVINPIDLTRFLLEGRSEARLPVAVARARVFLPGSSTLEFVLVPVFRAGRFDQLDEPTAPFDLRPSGVARRRDAPDAGWNHLQGGARVTSTAGRVDWGLSAYRGYRPFPVSALTGTPDPLAVSLPAPLIVETFPRFTMIGGDFETVRGEWGLRGEVAAFVDDTLQSERAARGVPGRRVEGGVGVDRRAGEYRIATNVLWNWTRVDGANPAGRPFAGDPELEDTDVTFVVAADRSFARQTRTLKVFSVFDPADRTVFGRVVGAVSLTDEVWLEGSVGIFGGASTDTLGRLTDRDFVYTRLKVSF